LCRFRAVRGVSDSRGPGRVRVSSAFMMVYGSRKVDF
jgi:hypothetical protein